MNLPGNIDLAMATAVWRRNLTVYKHTWLTNILPNFFEPVLFLIGMGPDMNGPFLSACFLVF